MSDGAQIAVYHEVHETGPTVMFSNSLGTDRRMWDRQVAVLSGHFSVLRYDTRGHGQSTGVAGQTTVARLAQDVVEVMDALALEAVHFCGLSLGGMTGQWLARAAPERFHSMTLAATSAYMGPLQGWQDRIDLVHKSGLTAIVDRSLGVWFTDVFRASSPETVGAMRACLLASDVDGYAACCAAIRDMDQRSAATENMLPTLVIAGADDPATPPDHGRFLADAGAAARLVVLPGRHLLNIETPAFTEVLHAFLIEQEAVLAQRSTGRGLA